MNDNEKMLGEERRQKIAEMLRTADKPITGRQLGEITNVSRQVIVSDITLLKARNEPIIATSQGYIYNNPFLADSKVEKTFVCRHRPEQTEEELNILVDHGLTVKDVKIEHPVYGDLTASIMVSNRQEVRAFIERIAQENAAYLLSLREGGIHLHTVTADTREQIEDAERALAEAGMLMNDE